VRRVIIDCDPGLDDAVAIMFALGCGRLDVKGITAVSGNLRADRCSINARKILELVDVRGVPVARGMQTPLVRPYPKDPFSHGDDGLANQGLPEPTIVEDGRFAPDMIVDISTRFSGDLSLLCLGPLTNIALAVMKDPSLPEKISELILIGGSYGLNTDCTLQATGDNPTSEWNVYVDPEAARLVFNAGFNLTAIGLDVATHETIAIDAPHMAALEASPKKSAAFLRGAIDFVQGRGFHTNCALIDSVAVAAAVDPTVLTTQRHRIGIETQGELTRGQTVVDRRSHFQWAHLPLVRIATAIDATRFLNLVLGAIA
jgi:inosine-uridine nucleoside N-ribohydrolase